MIKSFNNSLHYFHAKQITLKCAVFPSLASCLHFKRPSNYKRNPTIGPDLGYGNRWHAGYRVAHLQTRKYDL
jgi:hypothetical protein